jgi:hypothetical protein
MRACLPWVLLLSSAPGEDVAPLIQSHVRVLDAEPGVDLELHDADLSGSGARFPQLAAAVPGDILVSGRAGGFLRRVQSIRIDGDNVVAQTEPASLEDVFHQVHVRGANVSPSGNRARSRSSTVTSPSIPSSTSTSRCMAAGWST